MPSIHTNSYVCILGTTSFLLKMSPSVVSCFDQVNRGVTPWVIVQMHAPWYSSYLGHFKEVECMHETYEPLLLEYKVDIVINGHVHAYERTTPVVNWKVRGGGGEGEREEGRGGGERGGGGRGRGRTQK